MADHTSLLERPPVELSMSARSLADIDAELAELSSALSSSWSAPVPLRLTLAEATEALDELARGVIPATPLALRATPEAQSEPVREAQGERPAEIQDASPSEDARDFENSNAAPELTVARMSVVDVSFETFDIPDLPADMMLDATPSASIEVEAAPETAVEATPELAPAPVVEAAPAPVVEAVHEPAVEAPSAPVFTPEPVVEEAPAPTPEPVVEAPAREEGLAIEEALTRDDRAASATQTTLDLPDLMEFGPLDDVLIDPLATVIDGGTAVTAAPVIEEPRSPVIEATPAIAAAPLETSIEEALALIDEEPEFETRLPTPASLMPDEPPRSSAETSALASVIIAGEAEVSIDTDDVLIEAAPLSFDPAPPAVAPRKQPSLAPVAVSARPSDSLDLGELTFEIEPELGLANPEPSVSPQRLTFSSVMPRSVPPSPPSLPAIPSKPAPRATSRSFPPGDNLELDLAELLSEGMPPSVKPPPPLLRPPPPMRSAPPPVPRAAAPVDETDVVELIDEDAIEVVKASSAPPPPPKTP